MIYFPFTPTTTTIDGAEYSCSTFCLIKSHRQPLLCCATNHIGDVSILSRKYLSNNCTSLSINDQWFPIWRLWLNCSLEYLFHKEDESIRNGKLQPKTLLQRHTLWSTLMLFNGCWNKIHFIRQTEAAVATAEKDRVIVTVSLGNGYKFTSKLEWNRYQRHFLPHRVEGGSSSIPNINLQTGRGSDFSLYLENPYRIEVIIIYIRHRAVSSVPSIRGVTNTTTTATFWLCPRLNWPRI